MMRTEKEKASMLSICLDLKPPFVVKVAASQVQKFDDIIENTREHVVRFLDSVGAHAHNVDLCMREFFKSLRWGLYLLR